MSKAIPVISVVMAVYNGEKYLAEAIESVLAQTCQDFEFIIIDDASTDGTVEILQYYCSADQRISITRNAENAGLGCSLQKGISLARGQFIARMDADDRSRSDRFMRQIRFLGEHPEILASGGDFELISQDGVSQGKTECPKNPEIMRWRMLLGSGMIIHHGNTMFRREFFEKFGIYADLRAAQDFELWSRLFYLKPLPLANMEESQYFSRQHGEAITTKSKDLQEHTAIRIRTKTISNFLSEEIEEEALIAYRYPSLVYGRIATHIEKWIRIYTLFLNRFEPDDEAKAHIQGEMIDRLNKYSLLPFQKKSPFRVPIGEILKQLPGDFRGRFLREKLGWVMRRI